MEATWVGLGDRLGFGTLVGAYPRSAFSGPGPAPQGAPSGSPAGTGTTDASTGSLTISGLTEETDYVLYAEDKPLISVSTKTNPRKPTGTFTDGQVAVYAVASGRLEGEDQSSLSVGSILVAINANRDHGLSSSDSAAAQTAALQAAIDAAHAASAPYTEGRTVLIEGGDYDAVELIAKDNVRLLCVEPVKITQDSSATTALIGNDYFVDPGADGRFAIEGPFELVGAGQTGTSGANRRLAIDLTWFSDVKIDGLTIRDFQTGGIQTNQCADVWITNNRVINCPTGSGSQNNAICTTHVGSGAQDHPMGRWHIVDNYVEDCRSIAICAQNGFSDEAGTRAMAVIAHNIVRNTGLYSAGHGIWFEINYNGMDCQIVHNQIYGCPSTQTAIAATDTGAVKASGTNDLRKITIADNHVDCLDNNGSRGILCEFTDAKIHHNYLRCSAAPISITANTGVSRYAARLRVDHNDIVFASQTTGGPTGIDVGNIDDYTLANNNVHVESGAVTGRGINISGAKQGTVRGGRIVGVGTNGLFATNFEDLVIDGLEIYDANETSTAGAAGSGLRFTGTAALGVKLKNCVVHDRRATPRMIYAVDASASPISVDSCDLVGWVTACYNGSGVKSERNVRREDMEIPATPSVTATAAASGGSLADGTYHFYVTAFNNRGESAKSTEVSATVSGGGGAGKVTIAGAAIPTAKKYRIYFGNGGAASEANYIEQTVTGKVGSVAISIDYTGQAGTAGTRDTSFIRPYVWNQGNREGFSSQVPSAAGHTPTGGFLVADKYWSSGVAAGGAPGWVCTTAGSPGTWKAMASVAA